MTWTGGAHQEEDNKRSQWGFEKSDWICSADLDIHRVAAALDGSRFTLATT